MTAAAGANARICVRQHSHLLLRSKSLGLTCARRLRLASGRSRRRWRLLWWWITNVELQRRVSAAFPSVVVVENRYARGLSGARNSGVESTAGDLIVFFDDDAVADPGMVVALGDSCLDLHVLGAVAKIEPEWIGGAPRWFPTEFLWVVGCTYRGMKPGRVRNLIGAAMCVRRSVFESVGGFTGGVGRNASRLPLGCEETELCIRANGRLSRKLVRLRASCNVPSSSARSAWNMAVLCHPMPGGRLVQGSHRVPGRRAGRDER